MERTGHRSLEGVRSYKRTSEEQREALSDILNRPGSSKIARKEPATTLGATNTFPVHPAVLELGDMFYGGGVPIYHNIIQVEDGTQLETPGPTYSFDIMYNTSLSVNISAHNCAGYSDPISLVLHYDEG